MHALPWYNNTDFLMRKIPDCHTTGLSYTPEAIGSKIRQSNFVKDGTEIGFQKYTCN